MSHSPPSLAGMLLVSHPHLRDKHFCATVLLMHNHDTAGALGVVVNRPYGRSLGQLQPDFASTSLSGVPLFEGGPVSTDRLAFGGWCFTTAGQVEVRFGMGQEEAIELAKDSRFLIQAYIGYAGWSAGQLEHELRMNAWVVCPFTPEFADFEGEQLWKKLLEHHRPDLRLEADSPEDKGLN